MNESLTTFRTLGWSWVVLLLLLENLIVFGMAVGVGHLLVRRMPERRTAPPPPPLERLEIALTLSTIVLNTAVTVAGYALWREDIITFRTDFGGWALLDIVVLVCVMDAAMYMLHRIAHISLFYPLLHRTHHRYENPRPLTLFVLNPAETLSFGVLWLLVIAVYDASWLGMSVYLMLNVFFGAVGHLGVEPFPERWHQWPVVRWLTTSTFHAGHHGDLEHNFGFYTLFWDRLFGTLASDYNTRFTRAARGEFREEP